MVRQNFSIILLSVDWDGHVRQFISFSVFNCLKALEVWTGALSSWNK